MSKVWVQVIFPLIVIAANVKTETSECGRKSVTGGLILGGTYSARGQWPWLAALVYSHDQKYFCGSTLISKKHTITAAHCMQAKQSRKVLEPEQLVVLLGKHDMKELSEDGSETRFVKQIVVHPDWTFGDNKFDADIAIIFLESPVEFTRYISAVCLPTARITAPIDGGTIAGWGKADDADVRQNLLKQVDLKAVSNEHCFLRNYILAQISSNRTFCAGSERTGPCLGDSGGGFYVKSGKHWIMQGIISAAIMNDNDCDTDTFSIYTNVNLFTLWIKSVIEGTGPTGIYLIALNKSYDYERFDGEFRYTCRVKKLAIAQANAELGDITGGHIDGNSNYDVEAFQMHGERESSHLPNGIGRNFPNLIVLSIELGRMKFLHRKNFKNMPRLKIFSLHENEINDLAEDTFWDLNALEKVDLSRNNLIYFQPKLFINMPKLVELNANHNSLEFLDGRLFKRNLNLERATFQFNKINVISIDFNQLLNVKEINLKDNVCIDARFPSIKLDRLTSEISDNCNEVLTFKFNRK